MFSYTAKLLVHLERAEEEGKELTLTAPLDKAKLSPEFIIGRLFGSHTLERIIPVANTTMKAIRTQYSRWVV